jgi:hypothetical protein
LLGDGALLQTAPLLSGVTFDELPACSALRLRVGMPPTASVGVTGGWDMVEDVEVRRSQREAGGEIDKEGEKGNSMRRPMK